MGVIHSETFDSSSSLPSGWSTGDSGWSIQGAPYPPGISPTSPPNMLAGSPGSGPIFFTWGTSDESGGNVTVQANVNAYSGGNTVIVEGTKPSSSAPGVQASSTAGWFGAGTGTTGDNLGLVGVTARGSSATLGGSSSCYAAWINQGSGTIGISLWSGGSAVVLASLTPAGGISGCDTPVFTLYGSVLSLAVQQYATGEWLTPAGIWQTGQTTVLSISDSTLSGSGYSGLFCQATSGTFTGYFDDFSLSTAGSAPPPPGTGSLVGIESRDTGAMPGLIEAGGLSARESRDSAAFGGRLALIGEASPTEARDAGALGGRVETAILTRQESPDLAAAAGGVASGGTTGATEAADAPALHGDMPAASVATDESADRGVLVGAGKSVATATATEGRDTGSVFAAVHNNNTLAATEARDGAALAGSLATAGRLPATEARDAGSIVAVTAVASAFAAAEARDRGACLSVALGIPPSFRVREAEDVAASLGSSPTLRYNVYASPEVDEPIDYSAPVGTTAGLTWSSTPTAIVTTSGDGPFPRSAFPSPAFPTAAFAGTTEVIAPAPMGPMSLSVPGIWSFGVRAADAYGEEQNLDCSVTITLDATGRDISNMPAPPVGLRAIPTAGAGLTIIWSYPPTSGPGVPIGFHVYLGTAGAPDYTNAAATVTFGAAILGSWTAGLNGLIDGVTYSIGVRAFNAMGEEQNTATVSTMPDGAGPPPVSGLTATSIP